MGPNVATAVAAILVGLAGSVKLSTDSTAVVMSNITGETSCPDVSCPDGCTCYCPTKLPCNNITVEDLPNVTDSCQVHVSECGCADTKVCKFAGTEDETCFNCLWNETSQECKAKTTSCIFVDGISPIMGGEEGNFPIMGGEEGNFPIMDGEENREEALPIMGGEAPHIIMARAKDAKRARKA
eukprot:gb/GFBE01037019.1/.p1 GENE.gb/GFBE01037019.1/~~gb/GFBE01037019.1/.p1  ORF type:complete len:183 (+),score=39.34 gb/GFBE01037019.1/:1-549(+)